MAIVEICAGSINSAIAAYKGGANRIELCDNLYEGGTTPSYGYLKLARERIPILLHVLIRPRGGDFCYNQDEFEIMKEDIRFCKEIGMDGIVIGILNPDGSIDEQRTGELIKLARPLSVTFHRAFDMVPDYPLALKQLIQLGADRVLTSGQKANVTMASDIIKELIEAAEDEIIVLPGAGLNVENIKKFADETGSNEYHTTCRSATIGMMKYRNHEVTMGGLPEIPEFDILETDSIKVEEFVNLVKDI